MKEVGMLSLTLLIGLVLLIAVAGGMVAVFLLNRNRER